MADAQVPETRKSIFIVGPAQGSEEVLEEAAEAAGIQVEQEQAFAARQKEAQDAAMAGNGGFQPTILEFEEPEGSNLQEPGEKSIQKSADDLASEMVLGKSASTIDEGIDYNEILEKGVGGSYTGPGIRTGSPGSYKYEYPEEGGGGTRGVASSAPAEAPSMSMEEATTRLGAAITKQDHAGAVVALKALFSHGRQQGQKGKVLAELRSHLSSARVMAQTMVGRVEADSRRTTLVEGREKWTHAHLGNSRNIRDSIDHARAKLSEHGKSEESKQKKEKSATSKSVQYREAKLKDSLKYAEQQLDPNAKSKPPAILVVSGIRESSFIHKELSELHKELGNSAKAAEHEHLSQVAKEASEELRSGKASEETRNKVLKLLGKGPVEHSSAYVAEKHGQQTMFGVQTEKSMTKEFTMAGIDGLNEYLEKSGHKYVKRTGGPGSYVYTYADGHTSKDPGAGSAGPPAQPKPAKAAPAHDEEGVKELHMYADNDGDLHRQSTEPIRANLMRKIAAGTYDHEKAKKLWKYHADRAAQKYTKEFGSSGKHGSHGNFSPADRKEAASRFADQFKGEADAGEHDKHIPKKYKKISGVTAGMTKEENKYGMGAKAREEAVKKEPHLAHPHEQHYDMSNNSISHEDAKKISNNLGRVDRGGRKVSLPWKGGPGDDSAKKSFTGIDDLASYALQKSLDDIYEGVQKSEDLPSGEAKLDQGHSASSPNGGSLESTPAPGSEGKAGGSHAAGAPSVPEKKLSADDEEVASQLKAGEPGLVEQSVSAAKSMTGYTRQELEHTVAREKAAAISHLRKSQADVTVGMGNRPPSAAPEVLEKARYSVQGDDARVLYSNASDLECEKLFKSDFYSGGEPSLGFRPGEIARSKACGACGSTMAKSLSACPHCGDGAVTPQFGLSKSEAVPMANAARLRPARGNADLHLPNGTKTTKE